MPFNSSGIYSVLIDFATEAASPPIDIDDLDAQMVDIGTALTNCILRDGTGVPTADTPWADFGITGISALSASAGFQLSANGSQRLAVSSVLGTATQIYEPYKSINALKNIASQETGSFTATLTGCTTSPTGSCVWSRNGSQVSIIIPSITGTSNTTACTLTGLPAALQPARNQRGYAVVVDSGVTNISLWSHPGGASGVITLYLGTSLISATGFTNSGLKGSSIFTLTYALD